MKILVEVLSEIIQQDSIQINTDYEIPYLAGYSFDGRTIYIDKRLPQLLKLNDGRIIDVYKYLVIHEKTEKSLEDGILHPKQLKAFRDWFKHKYNRELDIKKHLNGYKYPYAHELATSKEREAVENDGIGWDEYQEYMLKMVKKLIEFSGALPLDLDTKPEKDTLDYLTYNKIKQNQKGYDDYWYRIAR